MPEGKIFRVLADTQTKDAVFIDFDNIEIGVKSTLGVQFDIGVVLEALKERGDVAVPRSPTATGRAPAITAGR